MKTAAALAVTLCSLTALALDSPWGWGGGGFRHEGYEWGLDPSTQYAGKPALIIRSGESSGTEGEANMGSAFKAEKYRGKRLRFSAFVKSAALAKWGGLWMRVDAAAPSEGRPPQALSFDNMRARSVQGTTGWTRYEIVLDVPPSAERIHFGFHLVGKGVLWMSSPNIEEVSASVPTTASKPAPWELPAEPQLDLSKGYQ